MNTTSTPAGTPADTVIFSVPGMTCGHCVAAVEGELGKVVGVATVSVDLDTKVVVVSGAALERAALVAAIDEAGFEVA
ncbi:MAG: cation transporter [Actinomycetota bacterium]|jgi:copper chaperone CopZ